MKKTAQIFLIIQKVISILGIISAAGTIISAFVSGMIFLYNVSVNPDSFDLFKIYRVYSITSSLISGLGVLPISILSLIFSNLAYNDLVKAKCRKDASQAAIYAIVAGVITESYFAIAAGVFMFVMKDRHYSNEAEEKPKVIEKNEPSEDIEEIEKIH